MDDNLKILFAFLSIPILGFVFVTGATLFEKSFFGKKLKKGTPEERSLLKSKT